MVLVYALTWYFSTKAGAAMLGTGRRRPVKADDIVNPVNTTWTLVTAFLVFFMQAGIHVLGGRVRPDP